MLSLSLHIYNIYLFNTLSRYASERVKSSHSKIIIFIKKALKFNTNSVFFCLSCNQLQPTFCATRYQRHFPLTFICIFCIIVKWANNWHNVHERPTKLKANAEVRVESEKWNVLRTAQRKHCMFQANINRILLYEISMKLS